MQQPDVYGPEIQRGRRYRSSDIETMDTETMDTETMDTETGFVGSRDGKNRNGE